MALTLAQFARRVSGGVGYTDRGQGDGGPQWLGELADLADDETALTLVSAADDPDAWERALKAADALGCGGVEHVAVGEPGDGDNPYQGIYFG